MSIKQTTATEQSSSGTSAMVQRLVSFDGPPEHFLTELVAAQCRMAQAAAGAVVQLSVESGPTPADADAANAQDSQPSKPGEPEQPQLRAQVMAVHPPMNAKGSPPSWLAHAIELAMRHAPEQGSHVHRLEATEVELGRPTAYHLVIVPVKTDHGFEGIEAFLIDTDDLRIVEERRQRIELSVSLLSLYEMRQALQKRDADLCGLSTAMRVLASSNDHARFRAAAISLCNEIASRWQADRVSLGLLAGRYVKLKAMSQTENLSRKMLMVQRIEAAMEECLDQDVEVIYPTPPEATLVSRAAQELSIKHGPSTVCSLPLRRGGEVIGVVTLERPTNQPMSLEEISFLRMACDLCTPRMAELAETDRWVGARLADSTRRGLAGVLGAKHTWAKLSAVALLAGLLALIFVPGTIRVEAPFELQAVTQRVVSAPFEGYLESVEAQPNDVVTAGAVLARLNTAELRAEVSRLEAERLGYEKEAMKARREGEQVEQQIAQARAANVTAQLDWLAWQIDHAVIRSPIGGTVVVGDLKQKIGAPVRKGDVLFEVAPLDQLRAELLVEDSKISDISGVGATGWLSAAADPGKKLAFEVEQVYPIAEVVDGRNVFRVRVKLLGRQPWAKPGIEGVAKIDAETAPLGWVWTRDAVNWVRMKLWI